MKIVLTARLQQTFSYKKQGDCFLIQMAPFCIFMQNWQSVGGQRILLNGIDIGRHAVGDRVNQRDADDTDGAGETGQQRAAFLGEQVF